MSDAMHGAIRTLQGELEATQQRGAQLERLIAGLVEIYGEPADEETPAPRRRASDTGRKAARPDPGSDDERILQQLRKHGATKPGALAKALKLSGPMLTRRLKPLAEAKLIVLTGKTAGRRISLPGASSGLEEP